MAYIKLTSAQYENAQDVVCALNYICDLNKGKHEIYGGRYIIALDTFNPYIFANQFLAVQYQRRIIRRIYHVIISLDQILDSPDLRLVYQIGMAVTGLYPNYQSVFTVHEDNSFLHIHVIFNNCSIIPDKKNLTYYFDIFTIQNLVDSMICAHLDIPEVKRNHEGCTMGALFFME